VVPDKKNTAPTAQTQEGSDTEGNENWLERARGAYHTSETYLDSNCRKVWDDSLRAFNNQHPGDSKYNNPQYEKRSHLYRPKIRSIIRKNEAAAATAFFSNMDTTSVEAENPSDKVSVASAEIMKSLLQYRLTKSVKWYHTVLGGFQDAQTLGAVCAHIYWEYKQEPVEIEIDVVVVEKPEDAGEYPEQTDLPKGALTVEEEGLQEEEGLTDKIPIPSAMQQSPQMQAPPTGMPPGTPQGQPNQPGTPPPPPEPSPPIPEFRALVDKPVVDIIPIENIRIDPSAAWDDPINTSPYVIHLIPMYFMDVKAKMKSGEWKRLGDGSIRSSGATKYDSTRSARQNEKSDPYDSDGKELMDYEIVWVQRHIHRVDDEDMEFYTMGTDYMLTTPRPLKESVFHGRRPYVFGNCVLETHKVYPSSIPQLGRGLADEANEIANQRIDNVKFVLNKKWFVKAGSQADISGLIRNVPGGVVMMTDPANDVREITWPDVTQSAYEESSRIDNDLAELLGNFNAAQVMADKGINGPARNMQMLSQSAGTLVEYLLRTYVETFVQPVLRQLMWLEQEYETDQTILQLAGAKSKMFKEYGLGEVSDELLNRELVLNVNVGMGATDPNMKLQKFVSAMTQYTQMLKLGIPGLDMKEVGKEIFGHLGYQDGSRFFTSDNPQLALLQQQNLMLNKQMQEMQKKLKDKADVTQARIVTNQATNEAKIQGIQIQEDNANLRESLKHKMALRESDQSKMHDIGMKHIDNESQNLRDTLGHKVAMREADQSRAHQIGMQHLTNSMQGAQKGQDLQNQIALQQAKPMEPK